MNKNRRAWLGLGMGAAALGPWRLWAAPLAANTTANKTASTAQPPRFLLVFLRGAYDSLNALVPYADSFYAEARPRIAVPAPGQPLGCLPLDGRWGLHPALEASLGPLWAQEQLAFVPFSGTSFVSRSHFQAQDWMEMANLADRGSSASTGFLNRLLQELRGQPQQAVALTPHIPLAMRGPGTVVNAQVSGGRLAPARLLNVNQQDALLNLYQGHPMAPMWQKGLGLENALRMASNQLAEEAMADMDPASRQAALPSAFALQAARMAQLLKQETQYRLGMVDVGGWDTHASQGGATGTLAERLRALGAGLATLAQRLGQAEWNNTVVVVMSEFGRTFHENGTGGTDHGHGSAMWLLGGGIRGGRIVGEQADLTATTLHQNRDVPVLNEYRAVLAGLFQKMYGLSPAALGRVFPDVVPWANDWV